MGQVEDRFATTIGLLVKLAGRGVGFAIGGPIGLEVGGTIVDHLVGAVEAEATTARLEAKIDRLIGMHYQAGRKWLLEAQKQRYSVRERYVENALGAFVNAAAVEDLPINAARAESYIGVCHGLLGRPDLSNFESSYQRLLAAEETLVPSGLRCSWLFRPDEVDFAKLLERRAAVKLVLNTLCCNLLYSSSAAAADNLYSQLTALHGLLVQRRSHLSALSQTGGTFNRERFATVVLDYRSKNCK